MPYILYMLKVYSFLHQVQAPSQPQPVPDLVLMLFPTVTSMDRVLVAGSTLDGRGQTVPCFANCVVSKTSNISLILSLQCILSIIYMEALDDCHVNS